MRFLPLALLALAAPAFAQSAFEPGAYANVNAGRTSISSRYADDSSDISLGGGVGYQFTANLGVEGYVRTLSITPFRGLLREPGYYPDSHYGLAVVASAPVSNDFSVYGRVGIGRTTMKPNRTNLSDRHESDPTVGAGLRYNFTRTVAGELEVMRLTKSDATLVSIGARFQF